LFHFLVSFGRSCPNYTFSEGSLWEKTGAAIPFHILGVPAIVAQAWEIILYPAFYLSLYLMPSELMGKSTSIKSKILTTVLIAAVGAFIGTCNDLLRDPIWVEYGGWQ